MGKAALLFVFRLQRQQHTVRQGDVVRVHIILRTTAGAHVEFALTRCPEPRQPNLLLFTRTCTMGQAEAHVFDAACQWRCRRRARPGCNRGRWLPHVHVRALLNLLQTRLAGDHLGYTLSMHGW